MLRTGRLVGGVVLALCLLAARAQAMEGMSGMYNTCMLMAGMHEMHFSAYQPSSGSDEEFCADIPSPGPVIVTINAVSTELLDKLTEIRIVRDEGPEPKSDSDLQAITLAYAPPKNYRTGIATLPVNFDRAGKYAVLVTVSDGKDMVMTGRMGFGVGQIMTKGLLVWVLYGSLLIAVLGIYLWVESRRRKRLVETS